MSALDRRKGNPRGEPGLVPLFHRYSFGGEPLPDLSDVLAHREADRPWLLEIWEPVLTKAPAPPKAQPHCCYLKTVIFYHYPYIDGPPRGGRDRAGQFHADWNKGFVEWDKVETRMTWEDRVAFAGELFEVEIGRAHV